jgi:hypothetical protein
VTVGPGDVPTFESDEFDGVQEISPFGFLIPGGPGDFRPVPADLDDTDPYAESEKITDPDDGDLAPKEESS